MLVDGIWMLVTNITETLESEDDRLKPEELIKAYRDKNRIEEAFWDVKSFIKFQPTFVYTDDHVREEAIESTKKALDIFEKIGLENEAQKAKDQIKKMSI